MVQPVLAEMVAKADSGWFSLNTVTKSPVRPVSSVLRGPTRKRNGNSENKAIRRIMEKSLNLFFAG